MKNQPKTLEEHREYLYRIVRLKLFFLHKLLKETPELTFADALENRVDIFRKTDLNPEALNPTGYYFDTPYWAEFRDALEAIWQQSRTAAEFEENGFEFIKPRLDARCVRDYRDRSATAWNQCGFLRHNFVLTPGTKRLTFHISNDKQPDSFFDYPEYIKECFLKLLDRAENMGAVELYTDTWLNSYSKWLAIFPDEWQKNLSEENRDVRWHFGFWGQFINSRGCFNYALGNYLRETGHFRFYPRHSFCSTASLRKKIESM